MLRHCADISKHRSSSAALTAPARMMCSAGIWRCRRREIEEHTAVVVDDGIATGATMRVDLRAMRSRSPSHLVAAVPVAPLDTLAELSKTADETVCLETPIGLGAIGFYYRDFHQMTDAEVTKLLARSAVAQQRHKINPE